MTSLGRLAPIALALTGLLSMQASAQRPLEFDDPEQTRSALQDALREQSLAEQRSEELEAAAARAVEAAERTARQAAAMAARIQEAEAGIVSAETRIALIDQQHAALRARLAERQQPLVRLTAALQKFSRRPVAMSVLRPGSVGDMVHLRAMLSNTVPEVRRRTAALRAEIERGRVLQREAEQAREALLASEQQLKDRRAQLDALETRQRLASRQASDVAATESQRALALAEQARDLDELVGQLDQAGALRRRLATLPGPIIRPARPVESEVEIDVAAQALAVSRPPAGYRLPVNGRTANGFGAPTEGGLLSKGLTLVPRPGAQVVAPAAGRVAFAGTYRGYGRIVIIEHDGGWTSLVTGLVRTDAQVGEQLVAGSPLGLADPRTPEVTLELRRDGEPVNPLQFLG